MMAFTNISFKGYKIENLCMRYAVVKVVLFFFSMHARRIHNLTIIKCPKPSSTPLLSRVAP